MSRQALMLVIALLTTFVGHSSVPPSAHAKDLKVAMILWRGETEAEKGFQDGLKRLGYSVRYTVWNAGQERNELGRLLREELKPKLKQFDYIYTFGTTASQATRTIVNDEVPQIFNIVADPVGAGIVQSMESPGGNISGASNQVSLQLQIETALKIMPVKRLGLLFNPREKNSMLIREKLSKIAQQLHIGLVDLRSPPAQDMLNANLRKLHNGSMVVDAVYLPQDSFLVSQAKLIGAELKAAKVKSIASIKEYVDDGALMGVVPDYYDLGKAAAMIVHRHQGGEKLQNIPVQTANEPVLVINQSTSRALNVDISEPFRSKATLVK
jgi:ABC-type uncharacterized transport system substrate-binding protein